MSEMEERKVTGWAALEFSHHILSLKTGPEDVAFKVLYCGIDHTDLHQMRNKIHMTNYLLVPGHEVVGEVMELGCDVKRFKVGDMVGVECIIGSCGDCNSCKSSMEQYCKSKILTYNGIYKDGRPTQGGFSSAIVVHHKFMVRIPEKLLLGQAAPLLWAIIRNFLWSGDPEKRKVVTVSWAKTFKPTNEGGLGLRRLQDINKSLLMKLVWEVIQGKTEWAKYIHTKFYNTAGGMTNYYKNSSMWPAIKEVINIMKPQMQWVVGSGKQINIWDSLWIRDSLLREEILGQSHLNTVDQLITNGHWNIPAEIDNVFQQLVQVMPITGLDKKRPAVWWYKWVWGSSVHPKISNFNWRLMNRAVPTESELQNRGVTTVSICCMCNSAAETIEHLFWDCSLTSLKTTALSSKSCGDPLFSSAYTWQVHVSSMKRKILSDLKKCSSQSKATMHNTVLELSILQSIGVQGRPRDAPCVQSCYWLAPAIDEFRISCDGASLGNTGGQWVWIYFYDWDSLGNPGVSGCGSIFRDHNSEVIGVMVINMPMASAFQAECNSMVESWTKQLGWAMTRYG
ncbi:hypothetical protein GIB67_021919 [Kingdonia uniflora]|uniref:Uncharacterized protein n=1 Tax=Kingdonia uniflora TaxID=39325 RepID=A0A7J7N511_9MAGN|nr:hypothetical protein GIB67_021919 [Kingdonia uniflora]